MSRLALLACFLCATLTLTLFGCQKSGSTREEKEAALAVAQESARNFKGVGEKIIEMKEGHGKMTVIIPEGLHPQTEAEFLQKVAMDWYDAYPAEKKPTVNDMIQVWLYHTDMSQDEVGFVKVYADQYGSLEMDFHHYKTQNRM